MAIYEEELKDEEVVEEVVTEEVASEDPEEIVVNEDGEVEEKLNKSTKPKKTSNKKPSKIKATFSELKKVTWPSFGSVVKKTAVVLSVTFIFLLVIIGIDQLLYLLYDLLTSSLV